MHARNLIQIVQRVAQLGLQVRGRSELVLLEGKELQMCLVVDEFIMVVRVELVDVGLELKRDFAVLGEGLVRDVQGLLDLLAVLLFVV